MRDGSDTLIVWKVLSWHWCWVGVLVMNVSLDLQQRLHSVRLLESNEYSWNKNLEILKHTGTSNKVTQHNRVQTEEMSLEVPHSKLVR